jgi:hypothetical protein
MSSRPSTIPYFLSFCMYIKFKFLNISCHILLLSLAWIRSNAKSGSINLEKCVESGLMIYVTSSNPGIGLNIIDIHYIRCEYDSLTSSGVCHLIHGEKIDENFGKVYHILEASIF